MAVLLFAGGVTFNAPSVMWASDPPSAVSEQEIFQAYKRSTLDLKPVAQIEAWLGYLRLHPDTKELAYLRARLRFIAAGLNQSEEEELLGVLAFQQLPSNLVALETVETRGQAARSFVEQHPSFFNRDDRRSTFESLLLQLGIEEPSALVAVWLGQPSVSGPVVTVETDNGAGDEPEASPLETRADKGDSEETGPAPEGLAMVAPSSGGPGGGANRVEQAGELASEGREFEDSGDPEGPAGEALGAEKGVSPGMLVAAIPAPLSAAGGELETLDLERLRFQRWTETTRDLSPEAGGQIWTTYLLLYPDSVYREQVAARIAAADIARSQEKAAKRLEQEQAIQSLAQARGEAVRLEQEAAQRALQEEKERQALQKQILEQERVTKNWKTLTVIGLIFVGLIALIT